MNRREGKQEAVQGNCNLYNFNNYVFKTFKNQHLCFESIYSSAKTRYAEDEKSRKTKQLRLRF